MESFDRGSGGERPVLRTGETSVRLGGAGSSVRIRTPQAYRVCDWLTGGLICWMVVFTPWAFGTTQDWSIWTMNITGYGLGGLLAAKWLISRRSGFQPIRWGTPVEGGDLDLLSDSKERRDWLVWTLALLTLLVLGYTLVSALNARATYIEGQRRFEYRECIKWLPHSYDSASTWNSLWMYLGLACFFWAARDWLLTQGTSQRVRRSSRSLDLPLPAPASAPIELARRESLSARSQSRSHGHAHPQSHSHAHVPGQASLESDLAGPASAKISRPELPIRLRLLLWVLCINGSLLALEAILQRLSGTNKLLWMVLPHFNTQAITQFGPYAYRANAASYFNLVWPVCLGFWLVLRESARPSLRGGPRLGSGNHIVLLPGAVLMAACPIISTSRGGALIAVAGILMTMVLLFWIARKESLWFRLGTCSLFAVILAFSAFLGLKELVPRFQTIFTDQMSQRTEIYTNALPIAHDFPVLGTGPGSFGSLYQLYRQDSSQTWAAYVHDDWLETRITYGWVGFSMILLMLGLVGVHWFWGKGIPPTWEFPAMIAVAMGGALLHAKFDFPFQIYSILFVFLLLSVILFCLSRAPRRT